VLLEGILQLSFLQVRIWCLNGAQQGGVICLLRPGEQGGKHGSVVLSGIIDMAGVSSEQ
jgi:hypothetical protein